MIWKNKEILSMKDLMDAIVAVETREEATQFIQLYELETAHARDNIGSCTGYLSREAAERIFELFKCEHPLFGKKFPTNEEAFAIGKMVAEHGYDKAREMLGTSKVNHEFIDWEIGILGLIK